MWWAFYLFSVAATSDFLNWTILGCIFLTGLFGTFTFTFTFDVVVDVDVWG